MIRITRTAEPTGLAAVRAQEVQRVEDALASGTQLSSTLVGTKYQLVARDLWQMQHRKCCYCESAIPQAFNDVEHYRPKASVKQTRKAKAKDGYWWLAWTWPNLLFSCPSCNRTAKNDLFPLAKPANRLQPKAAPPGQEDPLLIDPSNPTADPEDHVEFGFAAGDQGHIYGRTRHGEETIQVCALHRDDLIEVRANELNALDSDLTQITSLLAAQALPAAQAVWEACLTREIRSQAAFSAMRRARLEHFWQALPAAHQAALHRPPARVS